MNIIPGLISVIMPVYNVEKYIRDSVLSVMNQTYQSFELLIINDGSTDKSIDAVSDIINGDNRIRVYHKINGGLSDARNYGLERALGEYVYFIDSDDWIEPKLLEESVLVLSNENADIVVFGYFQDICNKQNVVIRQKGFSFPKVVFTKPEKNLYLNEELLGLFGYAWNKLYDNNFLRRNNFRFVNGVSLVEDILFNADVFVATSKIVILDEQLYHYMDRQVETLVKKFHFNSFELFLKKNISLNKFLEEWKVISADKNKILAQSLVNGIRYSCNNLFSTKNGLDLIDRIRFLQGMILHPETSNLIQFYQPITFKGCVYKLMIRYKQVYLLYLSCWIKKMKNSA